MDSRFQECSARRKSVTNFFFFFFYFKTEPRWPAFRYWLLNIVEQNKPCESFVRVLARLPEALSNFFMTQWHEEGTTEQINSLVAVIMKHLEIEELPQEKR